MKVGILGATGYTALELMKILLRHPEVSIEYVTSREHVDTPISVVHPLLRNRLDIPFEIFSVEQAALKIDFAFCCLPHAASAESVKQLRDAGIRVVDFSADYRLSNLETYESWYDTEHPDGFNIGKVPYGLPEYFREPIRSANLVANPGCFPTSAILGIAPFLSNGLIEPDGLIVDSKTGVSGAGRKAKLPFHFPECNESLKPYNLGKHRHQPEIDDLLFRCTGAKTSTLFSPHLVPMDRGILSTIYARTAQSTSESDLMECLSSKYSSEPFVRVIETLPETKNVSGTNYCDLTVRVVGQQVIIISAIDNLIKGASGAAVQNFNLMCGYPETLALDHAI